MSNVIVKFKEAYKGMSERVFSSEIHGEGYKEIAKEFADTNHGAIIIEGEEVLPTPDVVAEAPVVETEEEVATKKKAK